MVICGTLPASTTNCCPSWRFCSRDIFSLRCCLPLWRAMSLPLPVTLMRLAADCCIFYLVLIVFGGGLVGGGRGGVSVGGRRRRARAAAMTGNGSRGHCRCERARPTTRTASRFTLRVLSLASTSTTGDVRATCVLGGGCCVGVRRMGVSFFARPTLRPKTILVQCRGGAPMDGANRSPSTREGARGRDGGGPKGDKAGGARSSLFWTPRPLDRARSTELLRVLCLTAAGRTALRATADVDERRACIDGLNLQV